MVCSIHRRGIRLPCSTCREASGGVAHNGAPEVLRRGHHCVLSCLHGPRNVVYQDHVLYDGEVFRGHRWIAPWCSEAMPPEL